MHEDRWTIGSGFGTLGSPFGRRRMCCARTAALLGTTESQANANRRALQQFVHCVHPAAATTGQDGPKNQNRPRTGREKPAQAHDRPKTAPRQAQDRPKTGQDRPKTDQDRTKTVPRQAKAAQDRPKIGQDRPREQIWDEFFFLPMPENHRFSYGFCV